LPNLTIEYIFDTLHDVLEAHKGGSRKIEDIKSNTIWNGFINKPPSEVIIIDDVLTTGAHFRVCKDMINKYYPNIKVIGIFLALYTWES